MNTENMVLLVSHGSARLRYAIHTHYPLPKYGLGTIIVQVLEMQLLRVSTKGENIEIPRELSLAFTASDAGR